jgi:large subunit ribosomal protein L30
MAKRQAKQAEQVKTIKIKQVASVIGTRRSHREVLRGLGLHRMHEVVERVDTPAVRGMVAKIPYLVSIIEEEA